MTGRSYTDPNGTRHTHLTGYPNGHTRLTLCGDLLSIDAPENHGEPKAECLTCKAELAKLNAEPVKAAA